MEFTTFQTGPRSFQRCGRGTFVPGQVVDGRGQLQNEGNWALLDYMDARGIDLQRDPLEFEVYQPRGGSVKAGIVINTRCETGVPGLYAAGEIHTCAIASQAR